jgi:hypothetical protein
MNWGLSSGLYGSLAMDISRPHAHQLLDVVGGGQVPLGAGGLDGPKQLRPTRGRPGLLLLGLRPVEHVQVTKLLILEAGGLQLVRIFCLRAPSRSASFSRRVVSLALSS